MMGVEMSGVEITLLNGDDLSVLGNVDDDVFDLRVNAAYCAEFLRDPRHHICVARDRGVVVGFVSAVHYIHPDKPTQLWINEVGVAATHHKRGIAKALLERMFALGKELKCSEAWVLTDEDNAAARALYRSAGGVETQGVVMTTFPL